jgi:hypothetical protein
VKFRKNGNAGGRDARHRFRRSLHLHHVGPGADEPLRRLDADERRRQVAAQQRALHAAAHGPEHREHFLQRDLAFLLAPQVHAHRIADRHQLDPRALDDLRHRVVPGHHPDDLPALLLHPLQGGKVHQMR